MVNNTKCKRSEPLPPNDCKVCYNFFMCKIKLSAFILVFISFTFINNQNKQRKMRKKLKIRSYSSQVKKQFCCMDGVRVSTVIISAKRV